MTTSQPADQPAAVPSGLPPAGASIGATPGTERTVTAEEIGHELVNRCTIAFIPAGKQVQVRGRLVELVQPTPGGGHRRRGPEEPTSLYVAVDGAKGVLPFPVPTTTKVTVSIDPA